MLGTLKVGKPVSQAEYHFHREEQTPPLDRLWKVWEMISWSTVMSLALYADTCVLPQTELTSVRGLGFRCKQY